MSVKHARTLNERENAVVIGANFDELVRHHPSLKQSIFDSITTLLNSLYEKGKDYIPENADGYRLVQVDAPEVSASSRAATNEMKAEHSGVVEDVAMLDSNNAAIGEHLRNADSDPKREENSVLTFIAITGRVRRDSAYWGL